MIRDILILNVMFSIILNLFFRMSMHQMQQLSEIIMGEHDRLLKMDTKLIESDVKLICSDGELFYSRILFYLMEPKYKSLLVEDCTEDLVIINPSMSVNEVINFYEDSRTGGVMVTTRENEDVCQNTNLPEDSRNPKSEAANSEHLSMEGTESLWCEFCGKSYETVQKLKAHKKYKHKEGENAEFKCGECEKTFLHQFELNKHAFVHREPSFVCGTCEKMFKTRRSLVRHYDMFHDEKKTNELFQCAECPASFKHKVSFTRHQKSHNVVCLKCSHCKSTFKRSDNLRRHLKLVHKI